MRILFLLAVVLTVSACDSREMSEAELRAFQCSWLSPSARPADCSQNEINADFGKDSPLGGYSNQR